MYKEKKKAGLSLLPTSVEETVTEPYKWVGSSRKAWFDSLRRDGIITVSTVRVVMHVDSITDDNIVEKRKDSGNLMFDNAVEYTNPLSQFYDCRKWQMQSNNMFSIDYSNLANNYVFHLWLVR